MRIGLLGKTRLVREAVDAAPRRTYVAELTGAWCDARAMTEIPAENYAPSWTAGTRAALPLVGDEREILTAVLDWHRRTFELKCSGVPPGGSLRRASRRPG